MKYMPKWTKSYKNTIINKGFPLVSLLPSFLGVLMFFILPFFVVIFYAFTRSTNDISFSGIDNFISVISNKAFRRAAANTAVFSLTAVPLAVICSLTLAFAIMKKIPLASKFRSFFLTPLMVPVASIVLIWQVLFHDNGVINEFLVGQGIEKIAWFGSKYSQIMIVALFIWKNLGYNMILFMAAIASIPNDLLEVAVLDTKNSLRIFVGVKLRYLTPTILFVTIMSFINSFKVFREIYLLTTDYPYDTLYMLQHFMNNTFRSLDYQKLSAAAILMSIVMIVIIGALFLIESVFTRDTEG